jgi:hypothetical protein
VNEEGAVAPETNERNMQNSATTIKTPNKILIIKQKKCTNFSNLFLE